MTTIRTLFCANERCQRETEHEVQPPERATYWEPAYPGLVECLQCGEISPYEADLVEDPLV